MTTTATSMESLNTRPRRPPNARMLQNFHLVWLDENIEEVSNDNFHNSITKMQQVFNFVNTFIDMNQCIDFITNIKVEQAFLIVSEKFSEIIIPIVQEISQVNSVYIFCGNKTGYEKSAQEWPKVRGVFADITLVYEALKQAAHDYDENSVSISFVRTNDGTSEQNLDSLDQSFMYTQILKEILFTIDFQQVHFNEFLTYCREQFVGNTSELRNVDKIEKEYTHHQPIWWYTCDCFLYSMLNRALRLMEVDLIIKMGFFVRDLHNHIAALYTEQFSGHHYLDSCTVYRGQGLSQTDFDQLMKTKGGLMSFNNFLSTSLDRAVSLAFADSNRYNPDLKGVFFKITINPSISSCPFANIGSASYYQGEKEILFSMHSIFRIGQVKQMDENDRLWQVDLTLTSDNDPQLYALTERMRKETFPTARGWYRLGSLLLKLGQLDKAQQVFDIMLDQTTEQDEKVKIYHMLEMVKEHQGKFPEAIRFCQKALEIQEKTLPANHPALATSYNNIGSVYDNMGEYSKALSYYEKALGICQKTLPANHPDLANAINNIGTAYRAMGEHLKALPYYEKAFEIYQKTLPAIHPDLAMSYNNIGIVYENINECSKALSSHKKALEIRQKALPAYHPHLAMSYSNIGMVYNNMGQYSKALSHHEKALEIWQKTLPGSHPHLATSYNNIGLAYDSMDQYSKALSYFEKALEIWQKSLPANHSHFATSYNNIGMVYTKMDECSKALSYYEKALKIYQETLPTNHSHLAISYNNIGLVYEKINDYTKALSFYEHAIDIGQRSLPENHPNLQAIRKSIERVKKKR